MLLLLFFFVSPINREGNRHEQKFCFFDRDKFQPDSFGHCWPSRAIVVRLDEAASDRVL